MREVDAKVLGNIILLQSTIHLMQENDALAQFVCRGLSSIPGVQSAGMFINGAYHSDIGDPAVDAERCRRLFDALTDRLRRQKSPDSPLADFKNSHGLECLKIETSFDLYGLLLLRLTDPDRFAGYRPYIENTLNLIGLILENNHRKALLLRSKEDLEKAVETRTRELRASEEQYKALFESIRDAILVVDLNRNIISGNQTFTNLFGHCLDEVLGQKSVMLYADPAQYRHLGELLEKKDHDRRLVMNVDFRKKSGERFPGELNVFDLKDMAGVRVGFLGLIRDISDRVRYEEEKKRLEAQLFQARKLEAIGTLSGGVAHDINNILAIIIGNAEMAQEDIPEWSPARRFLDEVVKAGLRARDVVRQLLIFSRKFRERKKPLNLSPIVEEALERMRSTLPDAIDVRWSLAHQLPEVEADVDQILQMMRNLCSNAADAMSAEGGLLEVALEPVALDEETAAFDPDLSPGGYVRLTVCDTGPGILPGDADRIFDPYYSTKEVGKGTGMGLSVVHGIVKGHRGGIRVRNVDGRGAAFEVFLPAIET